jgi:hypothetical protein
MMTGFSDAASCLLDGEEVGISFAGFFEDLMAAV